MPLASALLLARAFTLAPLSEFATFLLWFAALAEEGITLGLFVSTLWGERIRSSLPQPSFQAPPVEVPSPAPTSSFSVVSVPLATEETQSVSPEEREPNEPEEMLELPPGVTQQLTRASEGDQEQIHGLVRASFVAGQRHAYLHLGFCPPLPLVPHVELHQLEGPEVQIKTGQVLTSGVRFDLKLREAATETGSAVFEFLASCSRGEESRKAAG